MKQPKQMSLPNSFPCERLYRTKRYTPFTDVKALHLFTGEVAKRFFTEAGASVIPVFSKYTPQR
ncbi:hypothetical protein [Porphyromonas canoris]|uniref:hypothetical protein n=1 Tax=Porphyromonas canoris TaxID=36875 RepID=UPI001269A8FD|nr:hypothetical protein [Porphyromonas canoris]